MTPNAAWWLSLIVAALTLVGVAFGRLPPFRMSRAAIAMFGATLLVLSGTLTLERAWAMLDAKTLVLLLSLMIVNAYLSLAGFFRVLTRWALEHATSPLGLLTVLAFASGVLSALFLNDTVVLMLTPLVVAVCRHLQRNPLPYLLALALSANVGSVATLTGNPQNLIIGAQSGLPYLTFVTRLGPVALIGLVIVIAVVALVERDEFRHTRLQAGQLPPIKANRALLGKGIAVSLAMLAAFLLGAPVATAALVAAAALLLTRRVKSDKLFARVNWNLLVLFAGLFVVTGNLEASGISAQLFDALGPWLAGSVFALTVTVAALSNLLSNVPAVLLLAPAIAELPRAEEAWLVTAMASTLAGNLTLVGSIANLIVAEEARREGVQLDFWRYARAGVPVTVLTLAVGVLWFALTG
jgi:Na+/H+ antiporter NhaD/arsenite permease-like protein